MMASAITLAACTALPQAPTAKAVYDFGPGLAASAAPPSAMHALPSKAIALPEVESISALEGTALLYRLGYANAQQLQPYAGARWSMPPAQLLRQRLVQQLSNTHAVLGLEAAAPLVLRLELDEFSHYFDGPAQSKALVKLRATLTDSKGLLLAQQSFQAQPSAPTSDAAGGAAALAQASDAVLAQLIAWLP